MPKQKQLSQRFRRRVVVHFGPEEPRYIGYSRNVSRTGMMVGAVKVFDPGTVLQIELDLPGGPLRTTGVVVWAREGPVQWLATGRIGMGITFLAPSDDLMVTVRAPAA
jgi:hypothetical protein